MKATGYGTLTLWPTRYEMLKTGQGVCSGLFTVSEHSTRSITHSFLPCLPTSIYSVLTRVTGPGNIFQLLGCVNPCAESLTHLFHD